MNRRVVALLAVVCAALVAWWLLEWILVVDRYRPFAERELGRLTGAPVSIQRLDLRLLPTPRLSALGSRWGEGDLRIEAERVDLVPDLRLLLRGQITLSDIVVEGLALTLPEDPDRIRRSWQGVREAFEAGVGDSPGAVSFAVRVDRVEARDVSLARGDDRELLAGGRISVEQLASDPILEFELPRTPWDASLEGTLALSPAGPAAGIAGQLRLSGLRTDAFAELPEILGASSDARVRVEGQLGGDIVFRVDGRLVPDRLGGPEGPVSGRLVLEAGPELAFDLESGELRARGRLGPSESGASLHIDRVSAAGDVLEMLVAALGESPVQLDASAAVLSGDDWRLELPRDGAPQLRSGRIRIEGVSAAWLDWSLKTPWLLAGHVEDGALVVDELGSGRLALAGTLQPDPDWERVVISATGRAELGALLAALGVPTSSLAGIRGSLLLDELQAVFPADPSAPPGLRARLRNGAVELEGVGLEDALAGIELELEATAERLAIAGRGRSGLLGDFSLTAARRGSAGSIRGSLSFAAAGRARDPGGEAPPVAAELLRFYAPGTLEFEALPTGETGDAMSLRFQRRESPALSGSLELSSEPGAPWLGDATLEAEVPPALIARALPRSAELSGAGSLRFERQLGEESFAATLDCTRLGMRLGSWIHKEVGEPLLLALLGGAPGEGSWVARELTVASEGERMRWVPNGDRWEADRLRLDLSQWTSLLAEPYLLTGRLEGSLSAPPLSADLRLLGVGISGPPELPALTLDGGLRLDGQSASTEEMRIRGPDTDVRIEATAREGSVSGRLWGEKLGVDALWSWVRPFRQAETAADDGPGTGIQLEVALDALQLPRSEVRNLRTSLRVADSGLSLAPLEFDTYEGRVQGEGSLAASNRIRLSFDIQDVTGRFLDDLFFHEDPRGIRGRFSGKLAFEGPSAEGIRPALAGGSGRLDWSARKGSFGRLGLATKLISVLRTAEVLRLKLPSIRDDGLVFDRVDSALRIESGRLEIERFRLEAPVYLVTATGIVDFAADTTSVPIEFDALRGVSSILQPIPVAGDVLEVARVRLQATGSPYQIKIGVSSFRDQVVGASAAVPNATVSRVRDALQLLKRPVQAPGSEPDPADPAEPPPSDGEPPPDLSWLPADPIRAAPAAVLSRSEAGWTPDPREPGRIARASSPIGPSRSAPGSSRRSSTRGADLLPAELRRSRRSASSGWRAGRARRRSASPASSPRRTALHRARSRPTRRIERLRRSPRVV